MNSSALAMMVITELVVTGFTLYFFFRVLTNKPKSEPDSFSENDDKTRR
jgi:Na+/H+ antiporter NhaD/arsenite permease-like protein